eukprot:3211564-Rhodomonas_salina.3
MAEPNLVLTQRMELPNLVLTQRTYGACVQPGTNRAGHRRAAGVLPHVDHRRPVRDRKGPTRLRARYAIPGTDPARGGTAGDRAGTGDGGTSCSSALRLCYGMPGIEYAWVWYRRRLRARIRSTRL